MHVRGNVSDLPSKKHHPRHEVDGIACSGIGGSVQTTAHFGGVRGIDAGAGWSYMGKPDNQGVNQMKVRLGLGLGEG